MVKYLLAIGMLCLFLPVSGQQVRFVSKLDARQVITGSTFSIEFILENADADNFAPPDFSPFKVISGPSQSYRSSFVNGVGSRSVGFGYLLQATRTGKFTIPGATVSVKGKQLKSNPVILEVLRGEEQVRSGEAPRIFIRAVVDTTMAYVGQQIVIRYKIYTQVNIENYNILTESNYDGCFAQALDTYKEPVLKEVVDGREYSTKVLRKVAVFPQQGGKIDISPMVVQVGVPSSSSIRRGLFSSFGLERKNISSNGISLTVHSAHDQSPGDFSGAVGKFNVEYSLRPIQATTDDAISIVMKIVGTGDVKTIRPPDLDLPKGFEVFDPKVKDEKMINATDSVRGEKVIEYLVIGHQPGNYQIQPSFTFFDPTEGAFRTVVDSFQVSISQGSGALSNTSDDRLYQEADDIVPLSHDLDLKKKRKPVYLQPWYIGAYVIPVLAFLLVSWRSKHKNVEEDISDPHAIARERLQQARMYMDEGNLKQFYEEAALGLKQFIAQKLQIQASDLSRQKITDSLLAKGSSRELEEQVRLFIEKCDLALYAGLNDASTITATYDEAVGLITELNQVL